MKGIIAAGGTGSRLYPLTYTTSKHLQSVFDKPLIYYPLTTLIAFGINEICIVSNETEIDNFIKLLGNGKKFGCKFHYSVQESPKGIPEVFSLSRPYIGQEEVTLILGDNIISSGGDLSNSFHSNVVDGATIFAIKVKDASRFGVVEFDFQKNILSLEEKPKFPKSDYAVTGIYKYDATVFDYVQDLKPSKRGELEITDLNNIYLKNKKLKMEILKRGSVWFDAGTPQSLFEASTFIEVIEKQTGVKIGCIEEATFTRRNINLSQLGLLIDKMPLCDYKSYLKQFFKDQISLDLTIAREA